MIDFLHTVTERIQANLLFIYIGGLVVRGCPAVVVFSPVFPGLVLRPALDGTPFTTYYLDTALRTNSEQDNRTSPSPPGSTIGCSTNPPISTWWSTTTFFRHRVIRTENCLPGTGTSLSSKYLSSSPVFFLMDIGNRSGRECIEHNIRRVYREDIFPLDKKPFVSMSWYGVPHEVVFFTSIECRSPPFVGTFWYYVSSFHSWC